jgi:hypothetical protein
VVSTTEVEFESHCRDLRTLSPALASYLDLHWWKLKHKIVRCWTNTYCHFEYRDTSAVEGTHAQCKRWLQNCNGDLLTVFKLLLPWWVANVSAVSIRSARDATILPYLLQKDRSSPPFKASLNMPKRCSLPTYHLSEIKSQHCTLNQEFKRPSNQ